MRKVVTAFLIISLFITLCACGRGSSAMEYTSVLPNEAQTIDFSNSVTVVTSPTPVPSGGSSAQSAPTHMPSGTPVPASTATPVHTAVATAAPTPIQATVSNTTSASANPITKSPYSDTVAAGGRVTFYATANNYTAINWKIKDPDGSIYFAANAPSRYCGLIVEGVNSTKLILENVPAEMNNCQIQAVFTVGGRDYYSSNAKLTVTGEIYVDQVEIVAETCLARFAAYGASYGYTVSGIQNYVSQEGLGDFNITFVRGDYTVIGQFQATYSRFFPTYVVVYKSGALYGQKAMTSTDPESEFLAVLNDPGGSFTPSN